MKDINARFGKGSLMKMGSQPDKVVDYISCGALTLDIALGGGFPKGRIVEVTSPFCRFQCLRALWWQHISAAVCMLPIMYTQTQYLRWS